MHIWVYMFLASLLHAVFIIFLTFYFLFIRIGTCGGIGLEPGTVVITEEAYDGQLRPLLDTVTFLFLRGTQETLDLL